MDTPIKQTKLNHESPFSWGGAAAAPPPKDVVPLFSRPSRPRVAQRCLETTKSRVFHEDVGWRSGRVDWFLWGRLGVVVVQLRVNNPVQVQEKRSEILNLDSGSFWITVCYCQSTCDVILHDSWFNQCFLMNKTYIKKSTVISSFFHRFFICEPTEGLSESNLHHLNALLCPWDLPQVWTARCASMASIRISIVQNVDMFEF